MPRQKSIVTVIRDLVRTEIQAALSGIFAGLGVGPGAARKISAKAKPKNGRRRRRKTTPPASGASGSKRGRRGGRRKSSTASEV